MGILVVLLALLSFPGTWFFLGTMGYVIWHTNTHDRWGRRTENFGKTVRKIKKLFKK